MQKKNAAKRSKIPYIFFAFFGVVIVLNIGYVYIAKKTWRGLATENSYQKGLDYNDTLKQAEEQKKLGWNVDVRPRKSGKNKMEITVNLQGEKSAITDANINITFTRPTQEGFDFSVAADTSGGTYKFDVTFPLPGQWDAVIIISRGAEKLYLTRRYVVQ